MGDESGHPWRFWKKIWAQDGKLFLRMCIPMVWVKKKHIFPGVESSFQ
jgi:hypothetical protein